METIKIQKIAHISDVMGKTKKVGSTGKFGVRYGRGVKKRYLAIDKVQKAKHACPRCLKPGLKRTSPGIWLCEKCGLKFAGRAYEPGLK
jgi:large subunit ribosomal protein L37Ae